MGGAGVVVSRMGLSAKSYASIIGSNNRINVAVIGVSGRGSDHINNFCSLKDSQNVQLKTLCDTDEKFWAAASKTVTDKTGVRPQTEWDLRKVFEDKDIHAV